MIVIILLIAILLLSIVIYFIAKKCFDADFWHIAQLCFTAAVIGILLLFYLVEFIPSKKNSEIKYAQLISEKAMIEQILASDADYDRIALNGLIIDYNNRVISVKENSQRLFIGNFYSNDVD